MFERNRVDNRTALSIAVELTFTDGSTMAGKAALPPARGIHQLLDGTETFLFIEVFGGESQFVPKATIRRVKLIPQVRPGTLSLIPPDASHFDPFQILGIDKSASADDVRAAYLKMAKQYHPDRFAGVDLPQEVGRYMEGMMRQVYAAFRALKAHTAAATKLEDGKKPASTMAEAG